MKYLTILIITIILLGPIPWAFANSWKAHLFDAGYGDAILLESPNRELTLIDAGGKATGKKLRNYLKQQGFSSLHHVVLTHAHDNHCLGLEQLAPLITSKTIIINGDPHGDSACQQLLANLNHQGFTTLTLKAGDHVFNNTTGSLQVLHPKETSYGINENSLVLWLNTGSQSFLFTADIGLLQQENLMKEYPFLKNADLVQLPHHGDKLTSTWTDFFNKAVFILSTGPNPYGLPLAESTHLDGRTIYRTDKDGTKIFTANGKTLEIYDP